MVNNLPAMQETWVQTLGQEDPLEKEMATHSSILAWEVPWAEEPTVQGVAEWGKTERLKVKSLSHVRLCNPMDCNLPGFSVRGIFQARVLEWVAISFSRGSS